MGLFSSPAKVYKPAADVDLGPGSDEFYISPNVKGLLSSLLLFSFSITHAQFHSELRWSESAPRVAGLLVKIFVWILEMPIVGQIVLYILKKDNLINKLVSDADIPEPPLFTATHSWEDIPVQNVRLTKPDLSAAERVQEAVSCLPARLEATLAADAASSGLKRWTIRDFSDAYRSGETTPVQVATRFLAAVKESSAPGLNMAFFISCDPEDVMRQAEESTIRYQRGAPLSALDGVLVAVKDEIDCLPYQTTGGTRWLGAARRCAADAACVAQLRACGAVLAGKANMHELGAGTSGINPHHGSARNPYNASKIAGGSSSGSAAVVCAGLCPVALGVDGGGSVRMPAALCGVVGFKPTAGRLSNAGVLPLNWTVGMPGILAGTVEDALIAYSAIVDQSQPSYLRPELNLPQLKSTLSMNNIKLAKYAKWFNDSDEDIRSCCDKALKTLQAHYGWETVDVTIPEIEEMRLAHYVTIGSECTTSLAKYLDKLERSEIGWDARVALSVYGSFSSRAYLNAQRLRNRQMYFHKEIFKTADVIVSPMTGVTAYTLQDDALKTGELDYINGAALVRYCIAGNFLGLPAITVMVTDRSHHSCLLITCLRTSLECFRFVVAVRLGATRAGCPSGSSSSAGHGPRRRCSTSPSPCRQVRESDPALQVVVARLMITETNHGGKWVMNCDAGGVRQGVQEAGGVLRPPQGVTGPRRAQKEEIFLGALSLLITSVPSCTAVPVCLPPSSSSSSMGLFSSTAKVYKPASDVDLGPDSDELYSSSNVKGLVSFVFSLFSSSVAPRVSGLLLKIVVWILEMPIVGQIVLYILKKDNLINKSKREVFQGSHFTVSDIRIHCWQLVSDADIPEPPLFTATHSWEGSVLTDCRPSFYIPEQNVRLTKAADLSASERVQEAVSCLPARLESALTADAPSLGLKRWTIRDFSDAYSSGETTPVRVATRFLAAVKESSAPGLNITFFISCDPEDVMRQAEDSALRHQRGAPLSVLDGVLVAVKDEIDCLPYPTTGGTRWLGAARRCTADAACVAQLRACGAVLAGKTNMHEIGAGASGINPHHGSTRSPYNTSKIAGGSSSGSAAAVCAGLCPVALGVDGGGSIRLPAALCGVVGLKPTAGRVSNAGVLPLNWTVGMPGILAGTVEDALIAYSAIVDQSQPSYLRPEMNLPQLNSTLSINNIKLAKYAKWFNDSADDIRICCDKALKTLHAHYGWQNFFLPLMFKTIALNAISKTVDVTIPEIKEMWLAHYVTIGSECRTSLAKYLDKLKRSEIGWYARVALSIFGCFSTRAYLNAQRHRNRQMYFHKEIFKTADAIVSPMTGVTACTLQEDALDIGELDYTNGAALVRYCIAGNFLGLPATTVMEACVKDYKKPAVFYDLLKKE
ncbi:Fatty acid amide hydrolase [Dichanthelium oligosanthes]|uniref:Fatty acid amide hydrolase n=1 Tax=Dichanthelium oligosanthes TaxID=888268 RepID=A0A1E5VVX1_9POAL|nr:Fatty acid amide hydrolase [Dichanthelium oligosanthes]